MVTQLEIARQCGLDVSTVCKILNRRPKAMFRKGTVQKVLRVARKLGYDFERLKHTHRRQFPRKEVAIATEFLVFRPDGAPHDEGTATIRELSFSGARVGSVVLPRGSLPARPFGIALRPMEGPLEGVEIRGKIIRLHPGSVADYGIEFETPAPELMQKLRRVLL